MIVAAATAVTTTPVKLSTTAADGVAHTVVVAPVDGTVYVGGANTVTSSTGVPVAVGAVFAVRVLAADALWAVTASGTANPRVMRTGADT